MPYQAYWDNIGNEDDLLKSDLADGRYAFGYRKRAEGFGVLSRVAIHRIQQDQVPYYFMELAFNTKHEAYPEVTETLSKMGYEISRGLLEQTIILPLDLCDHEVLQEILTLIMRHIELPPTPTEKIQNISLAISKKNKKNTAFTKLKALLDSLYTSKEMVDKEEADKAIAEAIADLWKEAYAEIQQVQDYLSNFVLNNEPFLYDFPILCRVIKALEPYCDDASCFECMENAFEQLMLHTEWVKKSTLEDLMETRAHIWLRHAETVTDLQKKKAIWKAMLPFLAFTKFGQKNELSQYGLFDSLLANLLSIEDYQKSHQFFDELTVNNPKDLPLLFSTYLLKTIEMVEEQQSKVAKPESKVAKPDL